MYSRGFAIRMCCPFEHRLQLRMRCHGRLAQHFAKQTQKAVDTRESNRNWFCELGQHPLTERSDSVVLVMWVAAHSALTTSFSFVVFLSCICLDSWQRIVLVMSVSNFFSELLHYERNPWVEVNYTCSGLVTDDINGVVGLSSSSSSSCSIPICCLPSSLPSSCFCRLCNTTRTLETKDARKDKTTVRTGKTTD